MHMKESDVRTDIERMQNEWIDKLEFAEGELHNAETRIASLEGDKKQLSRQIIDLKKDLRAYSLQVSDGKSELQLMQEKYEDMLNAKDNEVKQAESQKKHITDALQTEIDFFKKEVARLSKQGELKKQH